MKKKSICIILAITVLISIIGMGGVQAANTAKADQSKNIQATTGETTKNTEKNTKEVTTYENKNSESEEDKVTAETTESKAEDNKAEQNTEESKSNGMGLIAAALATGLACIGSGIAVAVVASSAVGAISENPKLLGKTIIFAGLAEGIAIYGLIISIMILNKV